MATHARSEYWDFLKALLIFCVTWGHMIQFYLYHDTLAYWDDTAFCLIYSFHMPLFVLISGYFAAAAYKKHGTKMILRYAAHLLAPCVFPVFLYIVKALLSHTTIHPTCCIREFLALWFLIVTMECAVFYTASKCASRPWIKGALIAIPFVAALFFQTYPPSPFLTFPHAGHFAYLWPFFLIGSWLQERHLTETHIKKRYALILIPAVACLLPCDKSLFVYVTPPTLSVQALAIDVFRTALALAVSLGVAACCKMISDYRPIPPLLLRIGRATLGIYVLQTLLINNLYKLFPFSLSGSIETFLYSIIATLLLYLLYSLLCRVPILRALMFGIR